MSKRCPRPPSPSPAALAKNPAHNRLELIQRFAGFGDFVKLPGFSPAYLVNSSEGIRDVLVNKSDQYLKVGAPARQAEHALGKSVV